MQSADYNLGMTQISLPCSPTPAEEDLRSSNQNPDARQFTWFEPRSNRWPAALVAAGILLASAAAVGYLATRPPGYDFRRDPGGFDAGVRTAQGYAAGAAVADWLAEGLPGRAARTVEVYRDALRRSSIS
jgi:hypothetical protein